MKVTPEIIMTPPEKYVHREQLSTETFIMNIKLSEFKQWEDGCKKRNSPFKSVRIGKVAYTTIGNVVEGYLPLFAVVKPLPKRRKKIIDL